jgi:hypothetical protein
MLLDFCVNNSNIEAWDKSHFSLSWGNKVCQGIHVWSHLTSRMACFLTSFLSKYQSEWIMYMYLYKFAHSSDTTGLSWGVRSHSFVYLDHMLSYVTWIIVQPIIINLLLFIADLFLTMTHSFLGANYSTKPHMSLETEPHTVF